jgi:succinyl-CoA synthetase beta subunit
VHQDLFQLLLSLFRGIIKATNELSLDIPLIVRLQGTKEKEAKK